RATIASTAAASATSTTSASPATSAATALAPSAVRSATTTVAPTAENARAPAAPIPDAPPVITLTRPFSSIRPSYRRSERRPTSCPRIPLYRGPAGLRPAYAPALHLLVLLR